MNIAIREAQESDSEALTNIYLDGAKYQYSLNNKLYKIPKRKDVLNYNKENLKSMQGGTCFVAEVGGQVVGAIGITLHRHGEQSLLKAKLSAELDISVKENMRGRGIGKKLIQEAKKWAKQRGADRIIVKTYAGNEKAINFYTKRNGFKIIGVVLAKTIQ